jgi:hypothetical protein
MAARLCSRRHPQIEQIALRTRLALRCRDPIEQLFAKLKALLRKSHGPLCKGYRGLATGSVMQLLISPFVT